MSAEREPGLTGQTVVVIGGSAGIGLETARRARADGAEVVLTGRTQERLDAAASTVGAARTAAFDANDSAAVQAFFDSLERPVDHVMVTAGGPYYSRLVDMDFDEARRAIAEHPMLMVGVARAALGKVRPGGGLVFMGGTAVAIPPWRRADVRDDGSAPGTDGEPRPRDRARAHQPDRGRLRRHTPVRLAPG